MSKHALSAASKPATGPKRPAAAVIAGCLAVVWLQSACCVPSVDSPNAVTPRQNRVVSRSSAFPSRVPRVVPPRPTPIAPPDAAGMPPTRAVHKNPIVLAPADDDQTETQPDGSSPTPDTDPRALLELAAQRYRENVRSYRCTFWRRERVRGKLSKQQAIDVVYRESPRAILMEWVVNPVQVKRCLYVAGRNQNRKGQECALVEPAGAIARLCVSKVAVPIHGPRAKRSSRYAIDEFGFRATLERLQRVNRLADQHGELDLRVVGTGEIDGRPTLVIERRLPTNRQGRNYPDAKLVLHLDRAWLLPVAMYAYADAAGKTLLGSYIITNIHLNDDFDDVLLEF